jgi:CPA1 family monovalent cation:H+ antiporter
MSASQIGLILLVACVVAMISLRLHLPYSVGLVAAGTGLALLGPINLALNPDLIFTLLLPPLISLKLRRSRNGGRFANLLLSLTLAFPGVLLTGAIVATGVHLIVGWNWLGASLFGPRLPPPTRFL